MKSDPHIEHLAAAARKGDARSQYELALHLARSKEPDAKATAKAWLLRAAEAGLRDAQLLLQMDTLALKDVTPASLEEVEPTKPVDDEPPPAPAPKREPRPAPPAPAGRPRRASTGSPRHDEAQRRIDAIEMELRVLGCWVDGPPPPEKMQFTQAFAMDTMAFQQWLCWVFIPRVRQVIAERGSFPSRSMVAAQAVREFDGWNEAGRLLTLLSEFDAFIERG